MMGMQFDYHAMLSPCIGICELDDAGLCRGCHRSGEEIAAWATMGDAARLRYLEDILPMRAAQREQE